MPIFSWVTPTFFALIRFVIGFANYSVKIIRHYRWNNGYLTPKTSLKQGFWGQMPVFSRVTPIFFPLSGFIIEFGLLWTISDQFGLNTTILRPFLANLGYFRTSFLTILSGFESLHNILGTDLGCFWPYQLVWRLLINYLTLF